MNDIPARWTTVQLANFPWAIALLAGIARSWQLIGGPNIGLRSEVVARVMETAASQSSPWEAVRAGLSTFLDACLEPSFRRIVVLDSVSVLQSQVMEVGVDPVELPMLRTVLTPLLGTTTFSGVALDALTYVALGGLYGASLYIARASDPMGARAEADRVLDTLIRGLLPPPVG